MTPDSGIADQSGASTALVPSAPATSELADLTATLPSILTGAGEDAVTRFVEYFTAHIRNPHTRRAYFRNALVFLRWWDRAKNQRRF
jgi:hypothetical protein